MSDKKNLLNETQVRQFMKLASLQPLTPGFVNGLTERGSKAGDEGSVAAGKKGDTDYSGEGEREGDESKTHAGKDLEEGHGRGANEYHEAGAHRGGGVKLDEEGMPYRDDEQAELGATEDELGAEDALAGEEGDEIEDLEGGEEEVGGEEETTLTVGQVVDAIENALKLLLPNTEIDAEYVGDEEAPPVDDDAEADFAPEGDDVVADIEVDEELEEALGFGQSADEKRKKLALGKKGSYAPDAEAGEKDYTPTPEEAAKARAHAKANPTSSRDKFTRRHSSGGGGGMKIGGITSESQDELVEQITKRVAARILKSALSKK